MSLEGQQVGPYRIVRQIGRGGMGEVFLAEDTRMPRQVAIKVVRSERMPYPHASTEQETARLFQREMSALSQLDHPNILSLYDFGEQQTGNSTLTYMVMPYRPEGSLADWLVRRTTPELLTPREVGRFVAQAAAALQQAHDHHIIHQDVKPSNFLVRIRPEQPHRPDLLLVDFGVAKITTSAATSSNSIRGTALYMAPEQWNREAVPATDQYALAVMAYQLLTGIPPFQGSPEQIMMQHLRILPRLPSEINPRISHALDAVLLRALAKKPEERFPLIIEFANAFEQAIAYQDLHSTLTISRSEARNGVNRTIMLPGKRQVTVMVPPNTYDGQVLRLPEQGEPYYTGGPRGPLMLTISVTSTEQMMAMPTPPVVPVTPMPPMPPMTPGVPFTPAVGMPNAVSRPPSSDFGQQVRQGPYTPHTPMGGTSDAIHAGVWPAPVNASQRVTPATGSRRNIVIVSLIAVAIFIILSSTLLVYIYNALSNMASSNAHVTATAQAQAGLARNAAGTATALTHATAVAATATAQAIAQNPDPYQPTGKLALLDPLSQVGLWNNTSATSFGGACQFANGAYDASQSQPDRFYTCAETQMAFSNFAFEVQMTITQGDCGGMVFRNNTPSDFKFYVFELCKDGNYVLAKYIDANGADATILTNGTTTVAHTGLNQMNVLAVVANNDKLNLYVNQQQVGTAVEKTYTQGYLALVGRDITASTVVVYKNARVWMI